MQAALVAPGVNSGGERASGGGEERISRGAGFALLAQLVGAACTAILTIFLARELSASQYGSLTFAIGVVAFGALIAEAGITSSADRFIAAHRGDPEAAAAVFRASARIKLATGLVVSIALFGLATPICHAFGARAAVWPLRALAASLLAQSMLQLVLGAFTSLGKLRYNLVITTVESVVELLSSIVLVLLGAAATGAALGSAIGYTAGALVGFMVARRIIGRLRSRAQARRAGASDGRVSSRQILGYAGPLMFVDAAWRVFASLDVLLIAALVGSGGHVASFGLPMRLTVFLDYPDGAIASAIAPRLARWRNDESDLRLFARSLRYMLLLQMLITVPLVIWPEAIVHLLFGDKYPEAPLVLRVLSPYVFLSGVAQIATLAVNYLGEARRRVPLAIGMLAINAAIDAVLLPRIGIVAGAIGTSAAFALWVPAHLWILHQRVGLRLWPVLLTTARACLAGAATVGALSVLGTGDVPIALMAVGAVVGPAVYLAALFALRELTPQDIKYLRGVLRRR